GLRVVGDPVGPLFAVAADENVPAERRVDPYHWADQVREHGFLLQLQPGLAQPDGTRLLPTTHLTVTPVTEAVLSELSTALVAAADEVRGVPPVSAADVLAALPAEELAGLSAPDAAPLDSETAWALLGSIGLAPSAGAGSAALPDRLAPFLALVEALPA